MQVRVRAVTGAGASAPERASNPRLWHGWALAPPNPARRTPFAGRRLFTLGLPPGVLDHPARSVPARRTPLMNASARITDHEALPGRDPEHLDHVAASLPEGHGPRRPVERLRYRDPVAEEAISVRSRLPLPAERHRPLGLPDEPEPEIDLRGRAEDESRPCLSCGRRLERHRAADRDHDLLLVGREADHVHRVARALPERCRGG